jgi:hypothetical protein
MPIHGSRFVLDLKNIEQNMACCKIETEELCKLNCIDDDQEEEAMIFGVP